MFIGLRFKGYSHLIDFAAFGHVQFLPLQLLLSYFEAYTLGSDKWIATFRACCMYQILDHHADIMRAYLEI